MIPMFLSAVRLPSKFAGHALSFGAALCAFSFNAALSAAEPRKPNIIVLFTDDQGYADISIHGNKDYQTPHLDSLAHNGVRCTSGYVTQPQCSPSRAGMLTGRHQSRFGHEENPPNDPDPRWGLPLTEKTLADYLKAAGYFTGHVGKWHQGHHRSKAPHQRGFMESVSVEGSFEDEAAVTAFAAEVKKSYPTRGKYAALWRNGQPEPLRGYVADALAQEVAGFIDRHHAEPFFLYWAHAFPHVPQIADEKYLERVAHIADEKRRVYAAMMLAVDDGVGRMLDTLRKHRLEENTLIFYMSDNGGPADGRLPCSNGVFTGAKGGMSEGGIRVPYFVQWKGTLPAGKVYDRPVSTLDIVPTALAAAGAPAPAPATLDGVNLLPFLKGEAAGDPHECLFWRYLRRGLWAIREGDWKLRHDRGRNAEPKLYNLTDDPAEKTDLASQHADRAKALRATYEAWARDLPEPLWRNDTREREE
ncbi:MAG: sulfatase-like hydrolase/transferase [Verrucomicrobiota bacterium]|nr:sulfatase-like hydrolase/transferase [Verrucomicrobiota bacterium]